MVDLYYDMEINGIQRQIRGINAFKYGRREMKENLLKIIVDLSNGIHPVTGEVFDREILGSDEALSRALQKLALTTQDNIMIIKKGDSKCETIRAENPLWKELRKWRINKAREIGKPGYCVLSDKVLWSIIKGNVSEREDLLFLKGIGRAKYDSYSAELIDIIKCNPYRE